MIVSITNSSTNMKGLAEYWSTPAANRVPVGNPERRRTTASSRMKKSGGGVIPVQLLLVPHPEFHKGVHMLGRGPLFELSDDSTGIVLGLKEARNQQRFEVPDDERGSFIPNKLQKPGRHEVPYTLHHGRSLGARASAASSPARHGSSSW
jgi:hypothetical protein